MGIELIGAFALQVMGAAHDVQAGVGKLVEHQHGHVDAAEPVMEAPEDQGRGPDPGEYRGEVLPFAEGAGRLQQGLESRD
jgi:hypothetical protein